MTTTAILLAVSATLIAAGVALIWRDIRPRAREAFRARGDPTSPHPEVEVTLAHPDPDPDPLPAFVSGRSRARAEPPPASREEPDAAAQWTALQPTIAAAVDQVNAVLTAANVAIGAPGAPSWSMNRGYGVYRRILVGGESLAWLRIELGADGQLHAGVKAHKDEFAVVNASASVAARSLNVAGASDLLSECLKPAASVAVRAANGLDTDQWNSETAWKEVDAVVGAALQAANGALAQAGARFLPLGAPTWVPDVRRHRLLASVEVYGTEVARLQVERIGDEIEVAAGVPDAHLADLARRERVALRGLTTHALAELIAGCAWPAIAHFRELQG
jgi:hypothetical protein